MTYEKKIRLYRILTEEAVIGIKILLTFVDAIQKGYTPLHLAAKYGSTEVARLLLLQDNINVDVLAKNGLTPLHVATHYGNYNVARLLLQHHASPHSAAQVLLQGRSRSRTIRLQ